MTTRQTIRILLLATAAIVASATSAHAQTAPTITGIFDVDGNGTAFCNPQQPYHFFGPDNGAGNAVICLSNVDSSSTIFFGDQQQSFTQFNYQSVTAAIVSDITGYPGHGSYTVDVKLCNTTACTIYPSAWTWLNGSPYPASVDPSQLDDQTLSYAHVQGYSLDAFDPNSNPMTVTICDQHGSVFYLENGGSLYISVPHYAGGPLVCDLTLSTNGGSNTLPAAFTYYDVPEPAPASVFPANGPVAGGTAVSIVGSYFGEGDTVTIDGVPVTDLVISSHSTITATIPASTSGAHVATIAITGPNGTGTTSFIYGAAGGIFLADRTAGISSIAVDGSQRSPFTSGGGTGLAVDSTGSVWSLDASGTGIAKFDHSGALVHDYTGLSLLSTPTAVATDGAGLIWITNSGTPSITAVTNAGAAVGNSTLATSTIGADPSAIVVDQTGGLWVSSKTANQVTHIIGAASPVVTPLATGVINKTVGQKP